MVTEISDEQIKKAREAMKWLAENPVARRLADAEEMQRRDIVSRIEEAREEGIEEGELRERQKTVLQLLGLKWSLEAIADFTGMPIDQIRVLENGSS